MKKLIQWIREYWYAITTTFAVIVFLAALFSEPTEKDPSGGAGFYAAMLAMCAAAIFIAEAAYAKDAPVRRWPGVFLGVVTMASAYLWVAAESEVHPARWELFGAVGLLWLVCAVFALVVSIVLLIVRKE